MTEWNTSINSDIAPSVSKASTDEAYRMEEQRLASRHAPEETIMAETNDTPEFCAFRDRIQECLDSIPEEADKGKFMQILNQLADKIDTTQITKSAIRKSAREQLLEVLDKLSEQHSEAGLVHKALRDADQTQAERALLNEPESTTPLPFRDVVEKAIKRASFSVPQRGERGLDPYLVRFDEVKREIEAEEANTSTPLIKAAAKDMAQTLVANLKAYRKFMVDGAPASEKAACGARIDTVIAEYEAWVARES